MELLVLVPGGEASPSDYLMEPLSLLLGPPGSEPGRAVGGRQLLFN